MTGPRSTTQSLALPAAMLALHRQLLRVQAEVAQLRRNQRTAQLAYSSVEGGTLTINDETGIPQIMLGLQADGTYAHQAIYGGEPPPPSTPLVSAGIGGLYVIWDGYMIGETPLLADFASVQIHCSADPGFTPGPGTLIGTLTAQGMFGIGSLSPGTTYYVCLITVNAAGVSSVPTDYVTGVPLSVPDSIPAGSITGQQIGTGAVTGDNIAASTIAAVNLVAGIIVAGIVDTTLIDAATLIGSTILGYATPMPRGPVIYDFEASTSGWQAINSALTQSAVWASAGTYSLLITASGAGQPAASSPTGLLGIPVAATDPLSVKADIYCPAALSHVYIGIQWYDTSGTLISETDCPDTVFAAGQQLTLSASGNAPANGFAAFVIGDHHTDTSGTLIYADNVTGSGNLIYSAAALPGTDSLGNTYDAGLQINGVSGLPETLTIQDPWGQGIFANIDNAGNITGQLITAVSDLIVGGESLLSDWLPSLAAGIVARTNIFASSLPAPGSPTTSEFYLFQIDAGLTVNRSYLFTIEPIAIQLDGPGRVNVHVYATTDGTQPTSASAEIITVSAENDGNEDFKVWTPPVVKEIEAASSLTWRFLVSVDTTGTQSSSGAPGLQVIVNDNYPGNSSDYASSTNARCCVYDMGPSIANTGRQILSTSAGSGSGTKNHTGTYPASASYSYQGSDGPAANARINTGGPMYQGGDTASTASGHTKTWIVFPYTTIASDLTGATITSVKLRLHNLRTYFSDGMTVSLGYDTRTVFGTTVADPAGGTIGILTFTMTEGQLLTKNIGTAFGTALASGATSLVLYASTNNLGFYGFFSGAGDQMYCPQLTIGYTK